jgi:hypothetical protein
MYLGSALRNCCDRQRRRSVDEFSLTLVNGEPQFMWRTIMSMKDFTGGHNRWLPYNMFNDPDDLVRTLLRETEVPWL